MVKTLVVLQQKAEKLKKDLLCKYSENKKLARSLIKGAESNADYRSDERTPEEKWFIYFVEELENRLK
jgi:hypothetical protein